MNTLSAIDFDTGLSSEAGPNRAPDQIDQGPVPHRAPAGFAPASGASRAAPGLTLGRLVGLIDGGPLVLLPGQTIPVPAASACVLNDGDAGKRVAVMFIDSDPGAPLIIGTIAEDQATASARPVPDRLELQAKNEIVLKCGRATLRLLADGTAVLRGVNVVTRAAATNRIRGGNVQIN